VNGALLEKTQLGALRQTGVKRPKDVAPQQIMNLAAGLLTPPAETMKNLILQELYRETMIKAR